MIKGTLVRLHIAAFAGLLLFAPLAAPQVGVTLFGAYSVSEGFDNQTTGGRAKVGSGAAFGVALDYGPDPARQLQLYYGQQSTTLDPGSGAGRFDFDIRYLHLGGTFFFEGPGGQGPYAVGGLGATHLSPKLGGLRSETRASLNVGFGYLYPLSSAVGLRAEARAFVTLLNSSSVLFCSGGCTVFLSGDAFVQGQALVGLTVKF